MTDNPRDILKAAGVECAALDDYLDTRCIIPHKGDAAILALARLVAPLARFLNAERALNDPDIMEGTTHCQTDAHVESDRAYREACVALGLDSFLEADND